MARYRKGNRYLSEEEYRKEHESTWIVPLFLLGAGLAGYFVSTWVSHFDLPKWLRFTAVILGGLIGGGVLGTLHKQIQILIGFSILSGIIYLIGSWIWENV